MRQTPIPHETDQPALSAESVRFQRFAQFWLLFVATAYAATIIMERGDRIRLIFQNLMGR